MEDKNESKENSLGENLSAVGQIILGEVEKIGGILTGDPVTNAEGDFNIGAGAAHQETNRAIQHAENIENTAEETEENRQSND